LIWVLRNNILFDFIRSHLDIIKNALKNISESEKIESIILNKVNDFDGIVKKWENFVISIT